MATLDSRSISEKLGDEDGLLRALVGAKREAMIAHQRAGLPVIVWKDGGVASVSAEEVLRAMDAEMADAPPGIEI